MSVTPIVLELQAGGAASKSSLTVFNDGAAPLPVEFLVARLDIDEIGKTQTTPAMKDFIVFPPQAVVAPGKTQTFRVQWAGSPQLGKSQSYMFSVNQVPVKSLKADAGMQLVFNFNIVVNVAPVGATSALSLKTAAIVHDGKGPRRPQILVANSGNRHASLSETTITLSQGTWTRTIDGASLRSMLGVGLVQPGRQRRFTLPIDLPPQVSAINARLEHQQLAKKAGAN